MESSALSECPPLTFTNLIVSCAKSLKGNFLLVISFSWYLVSLLLYPHHWWTGLVLTQERSIFIHPWPGEVQMFLSSNTESSADNSPRDNPTSKYPVPTGLCLCCRPVRPACGWHLISVPVGKLTVVGVTGKMPALTARAYAHLTCVAMVWVRGWRQNKVG